MLTERDIDGLSYPGTCPLCQAELGDAAASARIPRFDPGDVPDPSLCQYAAKLAHRECLHLWDEIDTVSQGALRARAEEFRDGECLAQGAHVGAWVKRSDELAFSHGMIYLARSVLFYPNHMGPDIDECEIRGRSASIESLLEVVGRFRDTLYEVIPAVSGAPTLEIEMKKVGGGEVTMRLASGRSQGLNLLCYLCEDDLCELVMR